MPLMNLRSSSNASHDDNRDSRRDSPTRCKASAQESEKESKNPPSNHPKRRGANYRPTTVLLRKQSKTKSRRETEAEDNGRKMRY
eukprot:3649067-Ditylum_brightwellii.AAC.1